MPVVRTTIDLPDELYRALKARAALQGTTLRALVRLFVEQGLKEASDRGEGGQRGRREPPPVIVPPRGIPIPATPRKTLRTLEEAEDEAKHAGSAGRERMAPSERS